MDNGTISGLAEIVLAYVLAGAVIVITLIGLHHLLNMSRSFVKILDRRIHGDRRKIGSWAGPDRRRNSRRRDNK